MKTTIDLGAYTIDFVDGWVVFAFRDGTRVDLKTMAIGQLVLTDELNKKMKRVPAGEGDRTSGH